MSSERLLDRAGEARTAFKQGDVTASRAVHERFARRLNILGQSGGSTNGADPLNQAGLSNGQAGLINNGLGVQGGDQGLPQDPQCGTLEIDLEKARPVCGCQPHPEKQLEEGEFVRPAVFGGLDGISTSFSLLAGAIGMQMAWSNLIAISLAQVFAGAFAMAFGEYVSQKAERQIALRELNREKWEVENYPEGEIAEMVEIYMDKGLSASDAQTVANTLSKYPKFWCEHMLLHEIGIIPPGEEDSCWKSSLAMFAAFLVFGLIPILTYVVVGSCFSGYVLKAYGFYIACGTTLLTLFFLGFAKNKIAETNPWIGGTIMLFQGAVAGALSYYIGVAVGQ